MYWTFWMNLGEMVASGGYVLHAAIVASYVLAMLVPAKLAYNHGKRFCTSCRFHDSLCGHTHRAHTEVENGCLFCDDQECNCLDF